MPFHTRADGSPDTVNVQMFWDSDVAKVIETAAYALYRKPNPDLEAKIDAIIDMFHRLQQPDGYLNSWFIRMQPGKRWTNLRDCHELYCAGHLMEAAVAYFHATGKRKLLDVMCRYADHIDTQFGPRPGQKPRLLRPRGDRTRAGPARPGDGRAALSRSRPLFRRAARAAAALFRPGGCRTRRRPEAVPASHL